MKLSSENLKRFLLDVLNQTSFPGHLAEFVVSAKQEIATAEIENTASDRMVTQQAGEQR